MRLWPTKVMLFEERQYLHIEMREKAIWSIWIPAVHSIFPWPSDMEAYWSLIFPLWLEQRTKSLVSFVRD